MSLLNELKRRNVFRVGAAYVVVAWLIIQVVETIFPVYGLSNGAIRLVVTLLAIGLLPVVILAWAFELTPEGLKKDKDVDRSQSIILQTGKKLDRIILVVLALALGYFAFDKFVLDPARDAQIIEDAAEEAVEQAFAEAAAAQPPKSIAVLPFDNRSNREEDQFFTDGIHDDLLTTISKIGSMKVISRTSVMEYKETVKKIREIAKELGVSKILEGGIQRSGSHVRINVQLIDAINDQHMWAETYDRELTAGNLFAIQSEITRSIADALHAILSPEERQRIDAIPTENLVAYDAYLLGKQLMASRDVEKLQQSFKEFQKAVELDPGFALAWVGVADSTNLLVRYGGLKLEESIPTRVDAINRALAIDDRLGQAYTSRAMLYLDQNLDEQAEAAFKTAIQLSPNYATAWQWYSIHKLRNPNLVDESIKLLSKAAELDPRSAIIAMNLANRYRWRGLYTLAEQQFLKVMELDPEFALGIRTLVGFYSYELGRFDQAIVYVQKLLQQDPDSLSTLYTQIDIYRNLGVVDAANKTLNRMKQLDAEHRLTKFSELAIRITQNDMAAASEIMESLPPEVWEMPRYASTLGYYYLSLGDVPNAIEQYLRDNPDWLESGKTHSMPKLLNDGCIVSWLLMETGDETQGRDILEQGLALFEDILPAANEHYHVNHPEICYLVAGDKERALQSIEIQLAHNHLYDWYLNHHMPMYDLIKDEPRYQAAWSERERRIAVQRVAINLEREAGE